VKILAYCFLVNFFLRERNLPYEVPLEFNMEGGVCPGVRKSSEMGYLMSLLMKPAETKN